MKRFVIRTAVVLMLLCVTAACSGLDADEPVAVPSMHDHLPAETPVHPLRAGERFVQLQMAKPYTPAAPNGGIDKYRCGIVDPQVRDPVFLTGVQYQPQNVQMAHHTITFAVPPEDAAEVRELDAEDVEEGTDGESVPSDQACWGEGTADEMCSPLLTNLRRHMSASTSLSA